MQATTGSTLTGTYDFPLVALSVFIAIIASLAALDLAARVTTARGRIRSVWFCCGSLAMGLGFWAMHYVGMEAFRLPVPVLYNWPTVVISLLAVVLGSASALAIVSRPSMGTSAAILGSISLGSGIAAMHYIGMAAMRLPAVRIYSPPIVTLTIILAIAISYLALRLTFAFRENPAAWGSQKLASGLLLGAAIPIMHYVGMEAVTFRSMPFENGSLNMAVTVSPLGLTSISLATLSVLCVVFITSAIDRRFEQRNRQVANSRFQMQAILDNMAESVLVIDLDGNTRFANQAAKRLSSMKDETRFSDALRANFDIFLKDGTPLPSDQWPINRALRGEFVLNYEVISRHKSAGGPRILEISTVPLLGRNGKTIQVIVTTRDLTEQRNSDEDKSRLTAIVETSDDAIIGKNAGGIITSWNEGAQKIFGHSSGEMIGDSIKKLLPLDLMHEEDEILQIILRDQSVDHFDTIRRKKDGKFIHVSLTITPIKDATGKVVGASEIARDITERKSMEQQLLASQKMEAIGQLTGGIAHDFNNLLGIIIGNLDLLERHIPGNEDALKRLHSAQKATLRGADLTRRLLTFASVQELNPEPESLNSTIQTIIELASRVLGPEIKISTNLEPSLAPILADPSGLENALLNLFVNARDAMPKGGALTISTLSCELDLNHPSVRSDHLKPGAYACTTVSDTGIGMSQETMNRAFEPFFTTKSLGKGTGLGLAMVYGFAKQSGGSVRLYSELNLGTTVSLFLPFATGLTQSHSVVGTSPVVPGRGRVVLVVDDEPDLVDIALVYLTEMGYIPLHAKDGSSALEMLAEHEEIDLVITDVIMPGGMNGVELVQKIRQLYPAKKIVYSSGFPADSLAEKSVTPTDGLLLRKPYLRAEFVTMVHRAMAEGVEALEMVGKT